MRLANPWFLLLLLDAASSPLAEESKQARARRFSAAPSQIGRDEKPAADSARAQVLRLGSARFRAGPPADQLQANGTHRQRHRHHAGAGRLRQHADRGPGRSLRIDIAKETLSNFVKGRQNDRIGFVMFSGKP